MTLEDITYDDVIEEAYDDYIADCEEVGQEPLDLDAWIDTHEAEERINKWCRSLGLRREQSLWKNFMHTSGLVQKPKQLIDRRI